MSDPRLTIRPLISKLLGMDVRLYALSAVLQSGRLGFTLLPGLIVREIFNQLAGTSALGWNLWTLCALLVAAALARGAVLLWAIFVEVTGVARAANRLREHLLTGLLTRPISAAHMLPTGDIVNRLNADTRAIADEMRALLLLFGMSVSALIAFGIMLSIAPLIALVASLPLLLATFLFQAARAQLERLRAHSRAADSTVSAFLGDMFAGAQAIQVAGAERRVAERLRRMSDQRRRAALIERLFGDVVVLVCTRTVAQIGSGLVLLLAGAQLRAGSFSIGDFALFVILLESIADLAFYMGMHMAVYRQAAVSLERVQALASSRDSTMLLQPLQAGAHVGEALPPLERLTVSGLTRRYVGGRGIEDIDLCLQAGTLTLVTGRVGAGKTTLLRTILGLIKPDAGAILWNDRVLEAETAVLKPPHAAYTSQVVQLLRLSIRDNILLGRSLSENELERILLCVDLLPDLASFADGLETQIGASGMRLSGGQAQRVAIARMLLGNAELLVMDDVSSALDVQTEQRLWDGIERLRKDGRRLTILAVSHRPELSRRADQVIVLEEGRVVEKF